MKFNLVVDIAEDDIVQAMEINSCNREDAIGQITNNLYLGLSCIDAMLYRTMGIDGTDSYVKNPIPTQSWGQTWGDNFPKSDQCPIDVIEHHAQANNVIPSDDVIRFARSMWNEGNLTEKLS